jgi:hypothetical protein
MLRQTSSTQYHAESVKPGFALFGGVNKRSDALRNALEVLDRVTLTLGAKIGEWISLTP